MSCAEIQAYLEGWSHLQRRIYGRKEEADHEPEEFEGLSDADQEALFRQMTMRPTPHA